MRFSLLPLAALILGLSSAPAFADSVLFSDLGTGGSVYDSYTGWAIFGSQTGLGYSQANANLFTLGGSGSQSITQIDLGVENASTLDLSGSFNASIWTDVSGAPGAQIANASWNLANSVSEPACCSLVTVSGISGVILDGGQQYFLIVAPVSLSDDSSVFWGLNFQGYLGSVLISVDGGPWSGYTNPLGAFDVLGDPVPEPTSILLSATGLAALFALRRRCRARC